MTNEQIIFSNRVFLSEQGVIGNTGKIVSFCDESGERDVFEPEEIHTFKEWIKLGRVVKKGEHAVAKFPIWQKVKSKKKDKDEKDDEESESKKSSDGRFFMKVAFFFTFDQTEAK